MSVSSARPKVALITSLPEWDMEPLQERYDLVDLAGLNGPVAGIRGLVTSGGRGAEAGLIEALPDLEVIAVYGVGYDRVDLAAATRHNVAVTNTPDVLTADVADMALALTLALVRRLAEGDRFVRSGAWPKGSMGLTASLSGARVGIVGLGRIGEAIARRFAGFDVEVGYYNRTPKADSAYRAFATPVALAEWADIAVIAVAGGAETTALFGAEAISALGPEGLLINISRGTTVEEAALIAALESGAIGGAGLDVFLDEPTIDPRLLKLANVLLSPHQGSATAATRKAMGALMRSNLDAHFSGAPLPTPVLGRR